MDAFHGRGRIARSSVVILTLIAMATTVLVAAGSAVAATTRRYEGTTSQGLNAVFRLGERADGSFRMEKWGIRVDLTCEDGSIVRWTAVGWRHAIYDGELTIDEVYPWGATSMQATFHPKTAEGTLRYSVALLTDDEQAQVCTTGDLTWTADRTDPPVDPSASGADHERGAEGRFETATSTTARSYLGNTSQDKKIAFELNRKRDGSLVLVDRIFKGRASCEDGTAWGFVTGSNQPVGLDGTDLSLDSVDLRFGLHLHGTFRPNSADGTLRWLMGALTPDEQAQICTTGDLTWTADRVDESNMPSGTGVARSELRSDFARVVALTAERSRR